MRLATTVLSVLAFVYHTSAMVTCRDRCVGACLTPALAGGRDGDRRRCAHQPRRVHARGRAPRPPGAAEPVARRRRGTVLSPLALPVLAAATAISASRRRLR